MNAASQPRLDLPPPLARQADRVCDAFEAAWKEAGPAGPQPRIEQYLGDMPEPGRAVLVRDLLPVELAYRRRSGERPTPDEYRARLPEFTEAVDAVFSHAPGSSAIPTNPAVAEAAMLPPLEGAQPGGLVPGGAALEQLPETPEPDWPEVSGYRIIGKLDSGGMGVVYKALQVRLNRLVALKMIRAGEYAGPDELIRFQVEAEAVARLDHPNVVRVYDFGERGGRPYFSMEFVDGGNLAQKLAGTPMPPRQAAVLVETLARALQVVHEQGIVHRDLKPANILLTAGGVPKIADFGLARRLDHDLSLTLSKTAMGTASYMAPEQAAGKTREAGPPADVYALGAILYEALTGRPPFRAQTRELTVYQVLTEEPVPPARLQPQVPPPLETVCLKCLEKEPDRRYAGAAELADDLHRFLTGEPVAAERTGQLEWDARWARRAGYEILDLLGAGLLGIVYKARHMPLNRIVTLKTISAKAQADPAKMARFRAEAEAAAGLQHPNIVVIFDFNEQSGHPYFSMEFLDGGTLTDRLAGGPLPAREAAEWMVALARATHHAHQHGIIHCDLRPFNVLVTAAGIPKIKGFGVAHLLGSVWQDYTWKGMPLNLSNYMAPEQAEGRAQKFGPATDVHALGAMLYEMLTGRPPFLADTVSETLAQIRSRQPLPLTRLQPSAPVALQEVCFRCLEKEPTRRYPSAEALAADLTLFLEGEATRPRLRPG